MNPKRLIQITFWLVVYLIMLPMLGKFIPVGFVPLVPFVIVGLIYLRAEQKFKRQFEDEVQEELQRILNGDLN